MSFQPSDIIFVEHKINHSIIAYGFLLGLGVLSVILRLYARWTSHERKSWGWDDGLIIPALVSFITFLSVAFGNSLPLAAIHDLRYIIEQ